MPKLELDLEFAIYLMDKEQAKKLLTKTCPPKREGGEGIITTAEYPDGTFLIRQSQNDAEAFILSYKTFNKTPDRVAFGEVTLSKFVTAIVKENTFDQQAYGSDKNWFIERLLFTNHDIQKSALPLFHDSKLSEITSLDELGSKNDEYAFYVLYKGALLILNINLQAKDLDALYTELQKVLIDDNSKTQEEASLCRLFKQKFPRTLEYLKTRNTIHKPSANNTFKSSSNTLGISLETLETLNRNIPIITSNNEKSLQQRQTPGIRLENLNIPIMTLNNEKSLQQQEESAHKNLFIPLKLTLGPPKLVTKVEEPPKEKLDNLIDKKQTNK